MTAQDLMQNFFKQSKKEYYKKQYKGSFKWLTRKQCNFLHELAFTEETEINYLEQYPFFIKDHSLKISRPAPNGCRSIEFIYKNF